MKTKNMKTRSYLMKETFSDQYSLAVLLTTLSSSSDSNQCSYYNCEKGPDLKVMTVDQFPIDSATFTKINNYQYKIEYIFNSKLNDGFIISTDPFSSYIINYELRQRNYLIARKKCQCNNLFSLRYKYNVTSQGFISEHLLNNANVGGSITILSEIILPVSFIVFNQQGLYYYLNVDDKSNVTFSPTIVRK